MSEINSTQVSPVRQSAVGTENSTVVFPALPAGTPAELLDLFAHFQGNPAIHPVRQYATYAFARGITDDALTELMRRTDGNGWVRGMYENKITALIEQRQEQKRRKPAAYVRNDIERRHVRKATRGELVECL